MVSFDFSCFQYRFEYPASTEPQWKNLVERWYQLDSYSYGLVQGYWENRESLGPHPDFLVLASPGASNKTDWEFAQGGSCSPQKFVHTLPNIRSSPLFQVMKWSGPMLCVNSGSQTITHGIREGICLLNSGFKTVWVLSLSLAEEGANAYFFTLNGGDPQREQKTYSEQFYSELISGSLSDKNFLEHLHKEKEVE